MKSKKDLLWAYFGPDLYINCCMTACAVDQGIYCSVYELSPSNNTYRFSSEDRKKLLSLAAQA